MTFDRDHFSDVEMPRLALDLFWDDHSKPFLMMHGPEPDLGWNQVTQIVIELAEHLKVSKTIGLQAIPWPSPHTRDLLVTPHASDPTMIEPRPGPVDRVDVPGSLTTLIEFATGRARHPVAGVRGAHPALPGQHRVPDRRDHRAGRDLEGRWPGHRPGRAATARDTGASEIDDSIASSSENAEVVTALELQHDADVASWPNQLPSGDELMDQIEEFLAGQTTRSSAALACPRAIIAEMEIGDMNRYRSISPGQCATAPWAALSGWQWATRWAAATPSPCRPGPRRDPMRAGDLGPYDAGEWADDTAMAIPILRALAAGKDLLSPSTQDGVVGVGSMGRAGQGRSSDHLDGPGILRRRHRAESVRAAALTFQAAGKPSAAGNAVAHAHNPITLAFSTILVNSRGPP